MYEGVTLSASGLQHIQTLTASMMMKKKQRARQRKTDPQIKHPSVAQLLALGQKVENQTMNEECEKGKSYFFLHTVIHTCYILSRFSCYHLVY